MAVDDSPSPDKPRAEPSSDPFQTPSRASRDVGDNYPGELTVAKENTRKRTRASMRTRTPKTSASRCTTCTAACATRSGWCDEAGGHVGVRRPTTCPLNAERMTKRVAACTRLLKQPEERPAQGRLQRRVDAPRRGRALHVPATSRRQGSFFSKIDAPCFQEVVTKVLLANKETDSVEAR